MVDKSMKKIGLFCLCLASLTLAGCFHVPDEDRLPSRNKVKTEDVKKDDELEQALNSFMNGIDIVSSGRNDIKSSEDEEINEEIGEEVYNEDDTENLEETTIDTELENIDNENTGDNSELDDIIVDEISE